MRTTVLLPDALAEEAKRYAKADGRTLTSLIEEGLRTVLAARGDAAPVELPVHPGGGEILVDILDKDALWAALDDRGAP